MDEKKRTICNICSIVGIVALLVYIILTVAGSTPYLLAIRLIFAGIAAIAYAIKLGVEISSEKSWGNYSVFLIEICLFNIVLTAMQLKWIFFIKKENIFFPSKEGSFFVIVVNSKIAKHILNFAIAIY